MAIFQRLTRQQNIHAIMVSLRVEPVVKYYPEKTLVTVVVWNDVYTWDAYFWRDL